MADKMNCWEIKRCEREPGGAKVGEFGVCKAATDTRLDGLNHGSNAGRICWAVAGRMCEGEINGSSAQKRMTCLTCEVYAQVKAEEGSSFVLLPRLNIVSD